MTPPAKLRTLDRGRLSGDLYRLVRKHSRLYALRRLLSIKTDPKPPRHLELTEDITDAFGAVMPGARATKSVASAE